MTTKSDENTAAKVASKYGGTWEVYASGKNEYKEEIHTNFKLDDKDKANVQTNEYCYSCLRGYCSTSEYGGDSEKFSIENFAAATERYLNPIPKPIVDDEDHCTPEEQLKLNKYYAYRQHDFHCLRYEYVHSDIKFSALKPGDEFNDEDIVAVDAKKNVIVTKDYDSFIYYYIKDPNSKPSLYSRDLPYVF